MTGPKIAEGQVDAAEALTDAQRVQMEKDANAAAWKFAAKEITVLLKKTRESEGPDSKSAPSM